MGQIQRLTRGRVKPYNSLPRIDWSHPLAVGLSTYCYNIGNTIVDLVNTTHIKIGGNGTAPFGSHTSPYGRGLQIPKDGWGSMPAMQASKLPVLGMVSPYSAALATYYVGAAGPASPDGAIFSVQDANNSESTQFGFNYFPSDPSSGGNDSIGAVFDDTVTPGYIPFNTLFAANKYQAWGVSCPTSTFANMYANGVLDKTNSASVNSPPGHVSAPQIMVNTARADFQDFGNAINGFVFYFAMWGRNLSAAEHLQLSQDPYCFLIYPEDDFLIVGTVGASTSVGSSSGTGSASGVGASSVTSTGTSTGTGSATGVGASTSTSVGSSSGIGTATGVGTALFAAIATSSGIGTASGIGASTAVSIASASGVGTASATGQSTVSSVASSAGTGTATGIAASIAASVGSSSGSGTALGVGTSSGGGSSGTSVGQGTASGVGASTATATASSTGTSSVSGIGASLSVSVGTSSGSSTVTATGFGSGSATGTSSGQGAASGIGSSLAQAIASASGIGIATGVGNSSSTSAIGTATGLATVLGVSATIVSAVGTASGNSTVTGISELLLGGKTWNWKKGYDDYVKVNLPQTFHDDKIKKAAAHMSSLGGHARAKSLTSTQRTFIATKAAKARWK